MALVLTLRQGQDFFVGSHKVVVSDVRGAHDFSLQETGKKSVRVGVKRWISLMPGVEVQAANSQNPLSKTVKVLLRAPGIKVTPGDVFRSNCPVCAGKGTVLLPEVCPACGGFGCRECTRGEVKAQRPCPECELRTKENQ